MEWNRLTPSKNNSSIFLPTLNKFKVERENQCFNVTKRGQRLPALLSHLHFKVQYRVLGNY